MFGHALHEDPEKNELLVKYAKQVQTMKPCHCCVWSLLIGQHSNWYHDATCLTFSSSPIAPWQLTVSDKIRAEKSALKKARSLLQMDELKCRKRVLRRLGYATASDVIEIKVNRTNSLIVIGRVLFRGCELKFVLHLCSLRDVLLAKSVPVTSWSSRNFFLMASSTIFRPNTPPPYSPALSLKRGRKKCLNWERNSQVNNKLKTGQKSRTDSNLHLHTLQRPKTPKKNKKHYCKIFFGRTDGTT